MRIWQRLANLKARMDWRSQHSTKRWYVASLGSCLVCFTFVVLMLAGLLLLW